MLDAQFVLAVFAAAVTAAGCWLVVSGLVPRHVRLADAFGVLAGGAHGVATETGPVLVADGSSRLERGGAWLYQHARLPLSTGTMRTLMMQGRSIGDYFVHKLVLGLGGLIIPPIFGAAVRPLVGSLGSVPVGVGLVCAVVGWLWPDITMRRQRAQTSADATEALNTYFDLVVLERLANLSATQSLEAAARLSDVPIFVRIRTALEQARLEQRPPWADLRRLARELELPPIADIADIMQLDDQGAALAEVLSARVKELRDAHLSAERVRAHQTSERMTLWMSIPVVIFALIFLIPPLLKIAGLA